MTLQKGMRGDTVSAVIKAEFGEKAIGESPKVECTPETPAEFNYSTNISVTFEDPLTLDEIACKPVICKNPLQYTVSNRNESQTQ